MNILEMSATQLDLWVAKAEGLEVRYTAAREYWRVLGEREEIQWLPHRDWSQAGPIIEREGIGFFRASSPGSGEYGDEPWVASDAQDQCTYRGATPLIAAMRVYVASKYGDNVPDA